MVKFSSSPFLPPETCGVTGAQIASRAKVSKKFKPHHLADDNYLPMYPEYINSLEVNHQEYDKVNNDFRHPYFINIKKQKK